VNRQAQRARAKSFRALHEGKNIFVLPNAWDVVSACILVEAGFEAIATTSGGCAFSMGYRDGEDISRDQMAEVIGRIANGVSVPVSADMEAGYGSRPEDVSDTVIAAIGAGAIGVNIEDGVKSGTRDLFDFNLSVERISAASEAADTAGIDALINARTDGFHTANDTATFDEAVRRANAYLDAGAGCVFVPFVRDAEVIGRLVKEINGPINILGGAGVPSVAELGALGVRRVTVGSNIIKAVLSATMKAAEELRDHGTFTFAEGVFGQPEIHRILNRS
jgi:2-methylisocitrate lyase-like PEP mutase family enzyme